MSHLLVSCTGFTGGELPTKYWGVLFSIDHPLMSLTEEPKVFSRAADGARAPSNGSSTQQQEAKVKPLKTGSYVWRDSKNKFKKKTAFPSLWLHKAASPSCLVHILQTRHMILCFQLHSIGFKYTPQQSQLWLSVVFETALLPRFWGESHW